jgi:hypothetical protein
MRMESSEAIIWGRGCQRAQARAAHLLPLRELLPLVDKGHAFQAKIEGCPDIAALICSEDSYANTVKIFTGACDATFTGGYRGAKIRPKALDPRSKIQGLPAWEASGSW